MAESERKRIRKKVIEILKNKNIPEVEQSIFSQRSVASGAEELPLIIVYIKSETNERHNESPKSYKRNVLIEIEINTTHNTDDELADEMDDLSQYVEDALEKSEPEFFKMKDRKGLDGLINDYNLSSSLYDSDGDGMNPVGSVRLVYDFEYYTDENRESSLADFKKMESTYHVNDNSDGDVKEISELEQ